MERREGYMSNPPNNEKYWYCTSVELKILCWQSIEVIKWKFMYLIKRPKKKKNSFKQIFLGSRSSLHVIKRHAIVSTYMLYLKKIAGQMTLTVSSIYLNKIYVLQVHPWTNGPYKHITPGFLTYKATHRY